MGHRTDYIPSKDKDFLTWVINFLKNLFTSLVRFGFPEAAYQELAAKRNTFADKLALADDPATRTKGVVEEKNEARDDLKHAVRQLVKRYLNNNPAVTNKDRDDLGLPIYKSGRTPSPIAVSYPSFDIDSGTIRRLLVDFYDQGSKTSKAKPAGQHGAEIRWVISDTPIVDVTELIHSSFDTRTPFTLEFQGHERGKTVYFCLCWENTRGQKGPWSEIQSAIIP
jgi:hypothetical protein